MPSEVIELLLQRLAPDVLVDLIGEDRLEAIRAIAGPVGGPASEDSAALARLVLLFRGDQLLEDPQVRRQFLMLLPPHDLGAMSGELAAKSFEKAADNALALASLPWRAGSPITIEFVRRFAVPLSYLPRSVSLPPASSSVRPFKPRPALRDYQVEVQSRVAELLEQGVPRILVQMPTGAGKTRTMLETLVVAAVRDQLFASGRSILWLAHVEELCEQALAAFEETWTEKGDVAVTVTRAWGSYKPDLEDYAGTFVVATYQKLVALRRNSPLELAQIGKHLSIIVVDEAHKVIAPTFKALVNDLQGDGATIIGLTATPGRGLEVGPENVALASFFDKTLVGPGWSDNPIRELRRRGVLARVLHRTIESEMKVQLTGAERAGAAEADLPSSVLMRLADSAERNRMIVATLVDEVSSGRACLVFACSVEHSRLLAAALNLQGCRAAHLDSSLGANLRKDLIGRFRSGECDVLLNFGVLSTGLDIPRISTVMIARPTTSVVLYSQMIGRGLRGPASGGSASCHLIDVRDNFLSFGAIDKVYGAFAPYWETEED